ncbi:MAG: class I SAM-dependent methyltransferase [Anaerovoracaceae bacterium]|jgi:16S rRNA (guanine1516-N2)-methyltransferase
MERCGGKERKIDVVLRGGGDAAAAELLADKLGTRVLRSAESGLSVIFDDRGAALCGQGVSSGGRRVILRPDFSDMKRRIRPEALNSELLIRAARIKGKGPSSLTVVDATAGLGEDSLLLAAAGYNVVMYENDPVIAALLRSALGRARDTAELRGAAARMELREEDSVEALAREGGPEPDIVYLDPMFPERKKSGAIKKKFQLLQQLERPCGNGEELLGAAVAAGPSKIVIKRPLGGEPLTGRRPDYSVRGKTVRFDCIVVNNVQKM